MFCCTLYYPVPCTEFKEFYVPIVCNYVVIVWLKINWWLINNIHWAGFAMNNNIQVKEMTKKSIATKSLHMFQNYYIFLSDNGFIKRKVHSKNAYRLFGWSDM